MEYAKAKKEKLLRKEEELERKINALQKDIGNRNRKDNETITTQRELEEKVKELERIIEHKTKGAILRAKCRWHNEGEKNTKYFLNLEKRHFKNSVISQLKVNDNDFVISDKEILNECETFYRTHLQFKNELPCKRNKPTFFSRRGSSSLGPRG